MKKRTILSLILPAFLLVLSCQSTPETVPSEPAVVTKKPEPVVQEKAEPEPEPATEIETPEPVVQTGWIGEHKYVAIGSGDSKQTATLDAQKKIMRSFISMRVKGLSSAEDIQSTGIEIQKQFSTTVRNGKILKEDYDTDNTCTIYYQIEMEDLKKRVYKLAPYNK